MLLLIICAGAYLAGSVNFPILLFRMLNKTDPRQAFSRNPGAFNVYRVHGFSWALIVLVLDLGRAVSVGLTAAALLRPALVPWVGLGLVIGDCFPCFHRFQGGKGVANFMGFYMVTVPIYALAGVAGWLSGYFFLRIAFIGSFVLVAVTAAGALIGYDFDPEATAGMAATVFLIGYRHRSNIGALFAARNRRR